MSEKTLKSGAPPCPDRYVAPECAKCQSSNTFTDKTQQLPPFTRHGVKCRNCGCRFTEISRLVNGVRVITASDCRPIDS